MENQILASSTTKAMLGSHRSTGTPLRCVSYCNGFTLAELAIVLVIVTLVVGILLIPLVSQIDLQRLKDTQRTLFETREALIGFASANGRLPCPASPTSSGQESPSTAPAGSGPCSNPLDGYVPAVTLGISSVDLQGYAIDAWGNRLRYAISEPTGRKTSCVNNSFPTMTPGAFAAIFGMRNETMDCLNPTLKICSALNGSGSDCATGATLASDAVAVLFSSGKNGPAANGADENANVDGNRLFLSHEQTNISAPGGSFDDIVTWLSPNILYYRMIAAGRLP